VRSLRPFYFIVAFWGERFRDFLADFCLPTLLSPNNIPCLTGGRRNRFIFCTTPEDWGILQQTPIFSMLARHVEPVLIEVPPAPPGRSACEHMGLGHKLALQMAHRAGAYSVFLTPDLMVSDGTMAAVERHARSGRTVVLTVALRFGEEPLFERLADMGLVNPGERLSQLGRPLSITGREMVAAGVPSFHSETQTYEFNAPYFASLPVACWWRVPGETGIVLHSLSWCPVLLDHSIVEQHDTSVLDWWTIDADYVYRNFGDRPDAYIVTDSDEMMLVSWAPMADRPRRLGRGVVKALPIAGEWAKGAIVRSAMTSGLFDPLKQRIFFSPVRWHAGGIGPAWPVTEAEATRILERFVPELAARARGQTPPAGHSLALGVLTGLARLWMIADDLLAHRTRLSARLRQALRGDRAAISRIARRIRLVVRTIRGTPMSDI
jgi:hypothetical protein